MAGKIQKNPFASQDKYLIAEQRGMSKLITGILIALFIGLLVRAAIAPARVRAMLEKAAQTIHKDIQVSFQDAELSLNDGILPRFAVVISDITMSSTQECWMQPRLSVDQIRLPISFWGLLTGKGFIRQIEADTVQVNLLGEYQNCHGENNLKKSFSENSAVSAEPARFVSLQAHSSAVSNQQQAAYADLIQGVAIERLIVTAEKYPQYQMDLHDLDFRVQSYEPRWYVLNAKTQLFHDGQVGDYLSHANIHLEYKEAPEATLQAHFFGNWREGYYSLVGNYAIPDNSFVVETELKHIPFSQILSLLQRYRLADSSLNARQLWLSFHSRFAGDVAHLRQSPLEITNLLVDGDQIEIDSDRILFRSIEPLKYDPIQLNIQHLAVDKILSFFNRNLPTRIFANMGFFTGRAEIQSGQDIRLSGRHSGLEFIFANKGQRELQTITQMQTEAEFKNENWSIQLSEVKPDQGVFDGQVSLTANKSFSDLNLKLKVDQALLAPAVQRLMTQGGGIGPLSATLDLSTRDRRISDIKGQLKVADMKVEGIGINATQLRLNYLHQQVQLDAKVNSLKLESGSYPLQIVGGVFAPIMKANPSGAVEVSNLGGQFQIDEFKTFRWKNIVATLPKNGRVQTEGAWSENGDLNGSIVVKTETTQKWKIGGTRAAPLFTPHEGTAK